MNSMAVSFLNDQLADMKRQISRTLGENPSKQNNAGVEILRCSARTRRCARSTAVYWVCILALAAAVPLSSLSIEATHLVSIVLFSAYDEKMKAYLSCMFFFLMQVLHIT